MTDGPGSVAPAWHTIVLVIVLLVNSAASARVHGLIGIRALNPDPQIARYLTAIIFEWLIVFYIAWGVRLRGGSLAGLIGGAWPRWRAVLRDGAIAIVFLVVANIVYGTLVKLLRVDPGAMLKTIVPRTPTEIAVYLVLALSAGFAEEVTFRGYLQSQFTTLTRSVAAAVVLQGVLFGLSHGYQGPQLMLIITVYGCLFGVLAVWRRSLRPGMMSHAMQDAVVILFARAISR